MSNFNIVLPENHCKEILLQKILPQSGIEPGISLLIR